MSLVNDMLRDLDARRRDTPARGGGTEKLVPAADEPGRTGTVRQQWLVTAAVILIAAAAGVAVALYLGITRGDTGRSGLPDARVVTQSEPAPASTGDTLADDGDRTAQQLEVLAARMAELEAANLRALREETVPDSTAGTGVNAGGEDDGGADPAMENPLTADHSPDDGWQARDWSAATRQEEPAATPRMDGASAGAADRDLSGDDAMVEAATDRADDAPVTRTPREPSFAERDRRQVQEALTQWSNGRQTAALEALDQFTLENPQAHQSREMLGKLLLQRGETGIAMQVADIGLQIAPGHNGYRKLKARLLMAANQPGAAVQLLEERPPSAAADTEYHELLATAALASLQYHVARRSYESLLGTDDGEGRWWYGLATALEGQGQASNAVRAYERAQRTSTLGTRLLQRSRERIAQLTAQ